MDLKIVVFLEKTKPREQRDDAAFVYSYDNLVCTRMKLREPLAGEISFQEPPGPKLYSRTILDKRRCFAMKINES